MLSSMLASVYFVLFQGIVSVAGQCTVSRCAVSGSGSEENLQRILEEHDHNMRSAFDEKIQTLQDQLFSRLELLINEKFLPAIDQINEKLNALTGRVNENPPNVGKRMNSCI